MALAITPRGDFGDSPVLRGFKARCETLAHAGLHIRRNNCQPEAAVNTTHKRLKQINVSTFLFH